MLRMSKILSGINLKTVDMNTKIDKAITKKVISSKLKTMESNADDNETLKSIKRWWFLFSFSEFYQFFEEF